MFSPPNMKTLLPVMMLAALITADFASAQSAEYQRRFEAMQRARARARAGQMDQPIVDKNVRTVAAQQPISGVDYLDPPMPDMQTARGVRVASRPVRQASRQPVRRVAARNNRVPANQYQPQHLRTAQLYDDAIVGGGSPIMSATPVTPNLPVVGGSGCANGGCGGNCGGSCGAGPITQYVDGGCGGCVDGSCGGCSAGSGSYFDACDSGWGGCPPGTLENCWIGQLPCIFSRAEIFGGGTCFQLPSFSVPGANTAFDDCNSGFYGGINFGIPLCKLSCGLFSGQVGIRSVNTNFDGNSFSGDSRDQLFYTVGLFRQVDQGLQGGVAFDFLEESWFSDVSVSQFRADVSWAWPAGSALGVRWASNMSDDVTSGVIDGTAFSGFAQSTYDYYKVYYRHAAQWGGWGEISVGATDDDHTIFGMDFDSPIAERLAMQAGFTYLSSDGGSVTAAGNSADAWNVYVGVAFRPVGRAWYKSYDRPMFSVADNGSMILRR